LKRLGRRTGKPGFGKSCELVSFNGLPAAIHAGSRYGLLTAADEKIPLPVVQVNNKPQYLVFQGHLRHPSSKQRHLPVESSMRPDAARTFAADFCPKFGAVGGALGKPFNSHSQA
jgi:hypothetical protein